MTAAAAAAAAAATNYPPLSTTTTGGGGRHSIKRGVVVKFELVRSREQAQATRRLRQQRKHPAQVCRRALHVVVGASDRRSELLLQHLRARHGEFFKTQGQQMVIFCDVGLYFLQPVLQLRGGRL
jgi:hypothetical protein